MAEERGHTHRAQCGKPTTNNSLEVVCSSRNRLNPAMQTTELSFTTSPQNESHNDPQPTDGDQRTLHKLPEGRSLSLGQLQHHRQGYGQDTQGLLSSPSQGMTPMARFESEQRGNAPWSMLTSKHCQDEKNAEKTKKLRRQEEDLAFVGGMFHSDY